MHSPGTDRASRGSGHRMDSLHVGNHRSSENGGAHALNAHWGDSAEGQACGCGRLGDVLRHSPVWRAADSLARTTRWRVARSLRTRGSTGGFHVESRRAWGNACDGNAVALATSTDERPGAVDVSEVCAALRGDR